MCLITPGELCTVGRGELSVGSLPGTLASSISFLHLLTNIRFCTLKGLALITQAQMQQPQLPNTQGRKATLSFPSLVTEGVGVHTGPTWGPSPQTQCPAQQRGLVS